MPQLTLFFRSDDTENIANSPPLAVRREAPHPPAAPQATLLPAVATGVPSPQVQSDWSAAAEPGSSAVLLAGPPLRGGPAFTSTPSGAAEGSGHLLGDEHAVSAQASMSNQARVAEGPAAGA